MAGHGFDDAIPVAAPRTAERRDRPSISYALLAPPTLVKPPDQRERDFARGLVRILGKLKQPAAVDPRGGYLPRRTLDDRPHQELDREPARLLVR
jgi:hypothetical protein